MTLLQHWMYELFEGRPGVAPGYPAQHREATFRALAEAWNWLEVQGLIVWPDEANGPNGWRVPSRHGEKLISPDDFTRFLRGTELPKEFLHPELTQTVWLLFLGGDFDTAVFRTFKQVEVSVRRAARLPDTICGVDLMRKAFHPEKGPLTDTTAPVPEREALSFLFAGAIGFHRNPHAHRDVGLTEPAEAREMIMLASHLLRIVDARKPS